MWIVAVLGEKGGSGKSCLCQNLAVVLHKRGRDMLLVDADPQATTVEWARERERNPNLPNIRVEEAHGDIRETLIDRAGRYELVLVDVGGADSMALRAALAVATLVVIPFRPKRRDLKTLPTMSELVLQFKPINPDMVVRSVITQAPALPSQVKRILDAKDACASFDFAPLNAFTVMRNNYDDADEDGSSVLEGGGGFYDPLAVAEIEAIAAELFGGA
jgi:chromosome partitioning protein